MSAPRPVFGSPGGRDPRRRRDVPVRAVVRTAVVALALTALASTVLLPVAAAGLGDAPDLLVFGVLLLLSSACRAVAGVVGARRAHELLVTDHRFRALPAVALGATAAWAAHAALLGGVALLGGDVPWSRVLLELPRWVAEASLAALLVVPRREAVDSSLRRYALHPRRGSAG